MVAFKQSDLIIIGGGLAGCEAAWQAARQGIRVTLYEMRPLVQTGAHVSAYLGELICSNSLGSNLPDRAPGLIKNELRRLDSLLIRIADETAVPAGEALAVDREAFAKKVTASIEGHPNIQVIRQEITAIPSSPTIIASGPLTSSGLSKAISAYIGHEYLYFYDAIAPIVYHDSIDMNIAYRASRYGQGSEGDYINCPMRREEYQNFVEALVGAEKASLREFEEDIKSGVRAGGGAFFEGCLPIEVLAQRDWQALSYGPLRPVGLSAERGNRPFAIVQLRQDNLAGSLYNLVGFQTNLIKSEQQRVFRMIPGLQKAEFARYGQMHRNTYIFSPGLLCPTLQTRWREDLFFAGQITGVEGYAGNIATGYLAGWNAGRFIQGKETLELPCGTMIGALCHYITHAEVKDFQPMKANFGILPPLDESQGRLHGKRIRGKTYTERASAELEKFLVEIAHESH